jgi:hypothetical protein
MSLRGKLEFDYTGQALAAACAKKRDHHQARLDFWQGELATAKEAFRSAAVQIEEYQITGGTRLQGVIDPAKQQRMDECHRKVTDHQAKVEEYDRWHRGFTANSDSHFALDPDDIAYFGL